MWLTLLYLCCRESLQSQIQMIVAHILDIRSQLPPGIFVSVCFVWDSLAHCHGTFTTAETPVLQSQEYEINGTLY